MDTTDRYLTPGIAKNYAVPQLFREEADKLFTMFSHLQHRGWSFEITGKGLECGIRIYSKEGELLAEAHSKISLFDALVTAYNESTAKMYGHLLGGLNGI